MRYIFCISQQAVINKLHLQLTTKAEEVHLIIHCHIAGHLALAGNKLRVCQDQCNGNTPLLASAESKD